MRSQLRWIHGRGEHVTVERKQTYAAVFIKFLVLVGLLYMPVLMSYWGEWVPFAGASVYLLWELGRVNSALGELTDRWNDRSRQLQEPARSDSLH
ncbi:hypothetical protein [Streptomyces sp. NPDC096132]|uniref:hypothetical protein n=1 Tax=Streptomyces sp. NPDC096132 TaxID=3366075 RepID=UPI0038292C5E